MDITGGAWVCEYYYAYYLTNLKNTITDSTVNLDRGVGSSNNVAIASNDFLVGWTEQVQVKTSDDYTVNRPRNILFPRDVQIDLIGNDLGSKSNDNYHLTNNHPTPTDSTVNFKWVMGWPGATLEVENLTPPPVDNSTTVENLTPPPVDNSTTVENLTPPPVDNSTTVENLTPPPVDDSTTVENLTPPPVDNSTTVENLTPPPVDNSTTVENLTPPPPVDDSTTVENLTPPPVDDSTTVENLTPPPPVDDSTTVENLTPPPVDDLIPPTASLTAPDVVTEGDTTYQFTVTYSDNTAMNAATLNGSDILVTGTNNFSQMAALVSVNNTHNGTLYTATYEIPVPGGIWMIDDNGSYTFTLQPNEVSDSSGNFMPASTLGSFLVNLPSNSEMENIVFPADAGVINVKTEFGAKGDGVTDDTAAIQAALNKYPNGNRIIYLPNGVYLVSDRLDWPAGTQGGQEYKRTILQGQSQQGTIIKIKDNAPEFTNSSMPKSVIFTGPSPAQRFRNSIRNLTVDTGVGNAGAIGVQFNASNQGTLREVTIRSGDGLGINGLDMNFMDEIGPLLVKNVTVQGFQYGIRTGFNINSQTFENIRLENQREYGFYNTGQIVNIRGLTSTNAVTAVYNAQGRMTLIDASFNGTSGAASKPALINDSANGLLVRNLATSGYQSAIESANTIKTGPAIAEFASGGITSLFNSPMQTLNLPIQETPDVPWDDPIKTPWANVVSFGAIPNDGKDDSAAIQAAIDSGKTTVYFPNGEYDVQATVLVRNNVRRVIGTEAEVTIGTESKQDYPGFKLIEGSSPVVVFERFEGNYYQNPTFENASARTIVIRHSSNVSGNMTGSGDVFLEDVVSNPFSNWTFNKQNVWARQLNVENKGTHIINNGGNLWILGLKTERGGTLIHTKAGGKTELLGGFAYTTTAAVDGTQSDPMFINDESSISISMAEVNYGGGPNYTTYVRETQEGVTRNLLRESLPSYVGSGRQIPLYVGFRAK
ncbi:MAG: glycosyl hydrolase family 28-related protein [Phormidium sp.]